MRTDGWVRSKSVPHVWTHDAFPQAAIISVVVGAEGAPRFVGYAAYVTHHEVGRFQKFAEAAEAVRLAQVVPLQHLNPERGV